MDKLSRQLFTVILDKYAVLITWSIDDAKRKIDAIQEPLPASIKRERDYPILSRFEQIIKELREDMIFIQMPGKPGAASPDLPEQAIQQAIAGLKAE